MKIMKLGMYIIIYVYIIYEYYMDNVVYDIYIIYNNHIYTTYS